MRFNRKIHDRPAFFPLHEDLAAEIVRRQEAVLERFPQGCKWLFPASLKNVDGRKPVSDRRMRDHLAIWLEKLSLTDEHGRPVKATFHQFRHTLATRMINAEKAVSAARRTGSHTSFAAIAKEAGVSRSWLYTQQDLVTAIRQLQNRPPSSRRTGSQPASATSIQRRLELALARIEHLRAENSELTRRLETAYGEIRRLRSERPLP